MDEEFQRAHYHDGYSRPPQRRHRSTSNNWSTTRKGSSYSYLTGPHVGVLVAIVVIYLFQKKDGFGRLLVARRERGLVNALMDWFLELIEYAIGYFHMALDVIRNIRSFSFEDWLPYDLNAGTTQNSTSLPKRRRNTAAQANRTTTSQIPELEETDVNKLEADQIAKACNINIGPLEPAFLRDDDYPPGWLVFDPVLGVVSKVEADKRKQKRDDLVQQTSQPQQQIGSSRPPKSPKEIQQTPSPPAQFKPNQTKSTPARPLHNGYRNPSPMHTPHPIVANG